MLSVYRNEIIFEECQYLLQGVLFLGAHLYGIEVFEKQGRGFIKWGRISTSLFNYNPSIIFTRA